MGLALSDGPRRTEVVALLDRSEARNADEGEKRGDVWSLTESCFTLLTPLQQGLVQASKTALSLPARAVLTRLDEALKLRKEVEQSVSAREPLLRMQVGHLGERVLKGLEVGGGVVCWVSVVST